MSLATRKYEGASAFNYHLLRNALADCQKNPAQLGKDEYDRIYKKASKSFELESLVINSPEANGLVISGQQLDQSISEVASRYNSTEEFNTDLATNGLDKEGLRYALYRELMFDGVMQRVAAKGANVNDLDIRLFYEMHHERFESPEQRSASHILITINPDFAENTRESARERMAQLVQRLGDRANRFHEFAKRHSECPTAMDSGKLGTVKRGQLYAELDAVLFDIQENEISPVIESEMGLHLMLCEKIKPGKRIPLTKAAPRIEEILIERQKRNCQKAWLAKLRPNAS